MGVLAALPPGQLAFDVVAQFLDLGAAFAQALHGGVQFLLRSGKTGLWSDVTEACPTGRPQAATLTWNVKAQHDGRVVVYLLDKNEQPRNFGQSGPVGSKQTGPWLRPGMVFRVRTQEDKRDLAELVIGEKPDC